MFFNKIKPTHKIISIHCHNLHPRCGDGIQTHQVGEVTSRYPPPPPRTICKVPRRKVRLTLISVISYSSVRRKWDSRISSKGHRLITKGRETNQHDLLRHCKILTLVLFPTHRWGNSIVARGVLPRMCLWVGRVCPIISRGIINHSLPSVIYCRPLPVPSQTNYFSNNNFSFNKCRICRLRRQEMLRSPVLRVLLLFNSQSS